jgi:rhomboid protease GluP
MAEIHIDQETVERYLPRRSQTWCIGVCLTLCATALVWVSLTATATLGSFPSVRSLGLLVLAGGPLIPGALALARAVMRRPRLLVDRTGIRLEWLLGSEFAAWHSLGAFQVTTTQAAIGGRTMLAARARIVGSNVSRRLRGKRQFIIPDTFQTPIGTLVAALNARQPNGQEHAAAWHLGGIPYVEDNRVAIKAFAAPWLTFALLAGLVAVFVMEQKFAIGPHRRWLGASLATVQAMGAVSGEAVLKNGEWYRLFTAPLLHGDLWHLIGNGLAMFMAGYVLENLAGRAWLIALFVIGGLGGSAMSVALNPAAVTSVGASGAIMALFAAGLISSFRMSPGPSRWLVQANFVGSLITSIIPLAATASTTKVDYAAHIGGALVGTVFGLILLCSWPGANRLPRFQSAARGIAAAGMLLTFSGSVAVAARYPEYVAQAPWISPGRIPKTFADMQLHGAELAVRYPQDPRAHLFYGIALANAHDYGTAEREFETALQETEHGSVTFGRRFDNTLWAMLAVVAVNQGQLGRARDVAQQACQAHGADQPPPELMQWLWHARLCN